MTGNKEIFRRPPDSTTDLLQVIGNDVRRATTIFMFRIWAFWFACSTLVLAFFFAIIHLWPEIHWLWWIGIFLVIFSFACLVVINFVLWLAMPSEKDYKKIAEVAEQLDDEE